MIDDERIAAYCEKLDQIAAEAFQLRAPCAECQMFLPDPVNPQAGIGGCSAGHGWHFPMNRPVCGSHEPIADAATTGL